MPPHSPRARRRSLAQLAGWLALAALACRAFTAPEPDSRPTAFFRTLTPTAPPAAALTPTASPTLAASPQPSATPVIPDSGWQALRPGLERRLINLLGPDQRPYETITLLRVDPGQFRFEVAYRPGQPLTLNRWQAETGALIVVNGGYYTEHYTATGLLISDGRRHGVSYGSFAGMLAINETGPELRWLAQRPYDPAEPLRAALQSFPLLVKPGGELGFPEEDGRVARRTVIGQDEDGRFVILVTTYSSFTLHQLSSYLVASDLALDIALNLDGGPSSGLLLADPPESVPAYAAIPAVIAIYPRTP